MVQGGSDGEETVSIDQNLRSGERVDKSPIYQAGNVVVCRVFSENFSSGPRDRNVVGIALTDHSYSDGIVVYLDGLAVLVDILAGEVRRMEAARKQP
jgi:hypothetical protein